MSQPPDSNLFRFPEKQGMLLPKIELTQLDEQDYRILSAMWVLEEGRPATLDPVAWEVSDSPKAQDTAIALANFMGRFVKGDPETYSDFDIKRMSKGSPTSRESRHLLVSAGYSTLSLPEIRGLREQIATEVNALLAPLESPFHLPVA